MDPRVAVLLAVLGGVALQRLLELRLSRAHLARRGPAAPAEAPSNWRLLVLAQGAWIGGTALELVRHGSAAAPLVFWGGLALFSAGEGLRLLCIRALGREWNARAAVPRDLVIVTSGPYRWLRHPNYLGVLLELAGLCAAAGAWITLTLAGVLHAFVLRRRIAGEDALLFGLPGYAAAMGSKGALVPRLVPRRERAR